MTPFKWLKSLIVIVILLNAQNSFADDDSVINKLVSISFEKFKDEILKLFLKQKLPYHRLYH